MYFRLEGQSFCLFFKCGIFCLTGQYKENPVINFQAITESSDDGSYLVNKAQFHTSRFGNLPLP
jgi:hypothetical protein